MTTPSVPLRRADWRFLLPASRGEAYEHLVLLGGPPGLAARLRDAGVARRVSEQLPEGRSADAVVVLRTAATAPEVAAERVMDGGVYYCEIDRLRPSAWRRTPAHVRRVLRTAGLTPIDAYWAIPDFERARRFLPLESAEALRWYFSTLQTAGSWGALLGESAVRAIVRGQWHRLARWVPRFGIVAIRREADGVADTRPPVLRDAAASAISREASTGVVMLTSGQDDGSRVVLLPFAADRTEPGLVFKVTRSAAFNTNLEREQLTLARLRSQLTAEMRDTIPEPVGTYPNGKLIVGMETYAPGPSLVVSSGRRGAPLTAAVDDLRLAADWLGRFHEEARCAAGRWDAGLSARVDRRLAEYERRFVVTAAEARLLALARRRSVEVAAAPLFSVWLHGDYGPWNVHRSGTRLTVIDWELGGEGEPDRLGPPLCDLLYFVTFWYHRVRHRRGISAELRGVRELFLEAGGKNRAVAAARTTLHDYLARLGVDPRFRPLLLVYTWVDRALDRADRGRVGDGGPEQPGNIYRAYVQELATRADRLFAAPEAA